jgi:hypothetical protein
MDVDRSNNKTDKLMDDGKSFDLLIENASHSFKEIFKRGYRCAAGGGTAVRCERTEDRSSENQYLDTGFSCLRPTGGRYAKNEAAGFLAGNLRVKTLFD